MVCKATLQTRALRAQNIAMFGGECIDCGSTEHLEFHHQFETEVEGRGREIIQENEGCSG